MSPTRTVTEAYLEAWKSKNIDALRETISDDHRFSGPMQQIEGGDEYAEVLRGISQSVDRLNVKAHLVDGSEAALFYDLELVSGSTVAIVSLLRVEEGKIVSNDLFYDAESMKKGMGMN